MRILVLSQNYDPEPIPKPGDLARELKRRGHDVTVVTGFPNYPEGRLYPGFALRALQREVRDGVDVLRGFVFPYHGSSPWRRIIHYASFVVSATFAAMRAGPFDAIYVWHPPLTVGIAAWLISRWHRAPFLYDVQDIWPESAVLSGILKPGIAVRLISRMEKFVYARASHILVVTDGARDNLLGKGVPPAKISVMPHWIDEGLFEAVPEDEVQRIRDAHGWGDRFIVLFGGNLGMVQGLDTVVNAARSLDASRTRIVLVGDGSDRERLRSMVAGLGVGDRVQFIDRQPMSAMPAFMAAADALLVHLKRSELSRYVIPTKTFAYLAAAKPIVMAMEGAASDLVTAAGAGIVIDPDDAPLLARTIEELGGMEAAERDRMGQNGRAYLRANFSKQRVIAMYEDLLASVAARPS